jgi:hypothetical protein
MNGAVLNTVFCCKVLLTTATALRPVQCPALLYYRIKRERNYRRVSPSFEIIPTWCKRRHFNEGFNPSPIICFVIPRNVISGGRKRWRKIWLLSWSNIEVDIASLNKALTNQAWSKHVFLSYYVFMFLTSGCKRNCLSRPGRFPFSCRLAFKILTS